MAAREMLHLMSYDIADDRRRRRVAAILEERAARVQQSVFELRMTTLAAHRLMARLQRECGAEDSIRLYAVPDSALERCRNHGGPEIIGAGRYWLA